jgi:pimeloyl-ACP methyl ester carboxylesterase
MSHPVVVCLAGAGSQSGRAVEVLDGVVRYLIVAGGYVRDDFVESSYHTTPEGLPLPYDATHSTDTLDSAVIAVARHLRWLRRHEKRRLHLLGWSLGGVVLFEAAVATIDADPSWADAFGAIVTLASPLLGSDLDGIDLIGSAAAGVVGAELTQRAADDAEKHRIRQDAERLREAGIRLVTIASEDDAVVTPEDALLPAVGSEPSAFILRPRRRPNAPYLESILGHGALPHDPTCWRHVLNALGPAE